MIARWSAVPNLGPARPEGTPEAGAPDEMVVSNKGLPMGPSPATMSPGETRHVRQVAHDEGISIEPRAQRTPAPDHRVHPAGDPDAELSAQRSRDRSGGGAVVQLHGPQPPEPARASRADPPRPEQVANRAAGGGRPQRGPAAARGERPRGRQRGGRDAHPG